MRRLRWIVACLMLAIVFFLAVETWRTNSRVELASDAVSGIVVVDEIAIPGAVVRYKGRSTTAKTDAEGRFTLPVTNDKRVVTASKTGYFIGSAASDTRPLVIAVKKLPAHDNEDYAWVDPRPDTTSDENCANCHEAIYQQWHGGGHARSATNRRFLSLYAGTNWHGKAGVGWSLADEHPLGLDVCASCHAPGHEMDTLAMADMRNVKGVARQGVHCDFCHKVQDVVAGSPGLTHGRFGFKLLRPEEGQLFFGPLDDVDRGEDAYAAIYHESRYCASCHEGVVFGVPVYTTYSEWLASPAKDAGKSCQTCHMQRGAEQDRGERMTNVAHGFGGVEREPDTLATHTLLPGGREAMLRRCLTMDVELRRRDGTVDCNVELLAHDVGHRVPTGFIDRHLTLVVTATDANGRDVALSSGETLPRAVGDDAGKAGSLFAKLLADAEGQPVPFWRSERDIVDTRLPPDVPVPKRFVFSEQTQQVRVQLRYRRFWQSIVEEKEWPDETIEVFDREVSLP